MPDQREPQPVQDRERINQTPGSPNGAIAPQPGKTLTLRADPTKQYVAGGTVGSAQWYSNLSRTLPWAIDDVTADFGDDLYERMLLDPQVASVVTLIKASVLEDGLELHPAVDDKDADGYRQAADLADQAGRMLADMEPDTDTVLWNLLDAAALGNRVAELIWRRDSTYAGTEQLALDGIHVKPRQMTAFVVDAFQHIVGLVARIPGIGTGLMQGILTDPALAPNLLPRDKFLIYSFRPKNGDPRGTSLLRPCYTPWQLKQQVIQEWTKYLTQFAGPSLVGTTPEGATSQPPTDSLGNPLLDGDGNPLPLTTPEQAMQTALEAFRNGSVVSFPFGASVAPLLVQGDGKAFIAALDRYDRDIAKAVTSQLLATEESEHQTRAASGTHQDVLDTIVRQMKRSLERRVRRDVLRQWVAINYGPDLLPLTPRAVLGRTEQQDLAALWTAVGALKTSGYLTPSQGPALDEQVSLPVRTPEEVAQAADMAAAAVDLAQHPPDEAGPRSGPATAPAGGPPSKPAPKGD